MTSANESVFRVTGHLCGEFTGPPGEFPTQRPVTQSFDVFFDLRLNKRLSKQSWGWWLETLSRPLWRHRNVWVKLFKCLGFGHWEDQMMSFKMADEISGNCGAFRTYSCCFQGLPDSVICGMKDPWLHLLSCRSNFEPDMILQQRQKP